MENMENLENLSILEGLEGVSIRTELCDLPDDILKEIFSRCPPSTFYGPLTVTCRRFGGFEADQVFTSRFLESQFISVSRAVPNLPQQNATFVKYHLGEDSFKEKFEVTFPFNFIFKLSKGVALLEVGGVVGARNLMTKQTSSVPRLADLMNIEVIVNEGVKLVHATRTHMRTIELSVLTLGEDEAWRSRLEVFDSNVEEVQGTSSISTDRYAIWPRYVVIVGGVKKFLALDIETEMTVTVMPPEGNLGEFVSFHRKGFFLDSRAECWTLDEDFTLGRRSPDD